VRLGLGRALGLRAAAESSCGVPALLTPGKADQCVIELRSALPRFVIAGDNVSVRGVGEVFSGGCVAHGVLFSR